ncbi:hypothetical protein [Limnohabitans sp.]|jgi:hypothetical protein|uniref:hypothetical protein n=1 Tax=Limnohabitans sp. TaxID=1907725 RepID=UPI0037C14A64
MSLVGSVSERHGTPNVRAVSERSYTPPHVVAGSDRHGMPFVGAVSDREASIAHREASIAHREASISDRAATHLPMHKP